LSDISKPALVALAATSRFCWVSYGQPNTPTRRCAAIEEKSCEA